MTLIRQMRKSTIISIWIALLYILLVSSVVKADSDWTPLTKGSTIYVKDWKTWSIGSETIGATSFLVSKKKPSSSTQGNLLQVNCTDGSFRESFFQGSSLINQVEGNKTRIDADSVPAKLIDFVCH